LKKLKLPKQEDKGSVKGHINCWCSCEKMGKVS